MKKIIKLIVYSACIFSIVLCQLAYGNEGGEISSGKKMTTGLSVEKYILNADKNGTKNDIVVSSLFIKGDIDLRNSNFRGKIVIKDCIVDGDLIIYGAHLGDLEIIDSTIRSIEAENSVFERSITIYGGTSKHGERSKVSRVNIKGSKIGGLVDFVNVDFDGAGEISINAELSKIDGSVFIRNSKVNGGVVFFGSVVDGVFDMINTSILGDGSDFSLNAIGISVKSDVVLADGFVSSKGVYFGNSVIGGSINGSSGEFSSNNDEAAVSLENSLVNNSVRFDFGSKVSGMISLVNTKIVNDFVLVNSQFSNGTGNVVINGSRMQVGGAVVFSQLDKDLNKIKIKGVIVLADSELGGVQSEGGYFENTKGYTLDASRSKIKKYCKLGYGLKSKGMISLVGANIGGDLDLTGGKFISEVGKISIDMSNAAIDGKLSIGSYVSDEFNSTFKSVGFVLLSGVRIASSFVVSSGEFSNNGYASIRLNNSIVKGDVWFGDNFLSVGTIDLSGSKVGGNLVFSDGTVKGGSGDVVINARDAEIEGSIEISPIITDKYDEIIKSEGCVILSGSKVGKDLVINSGLFNKESGKVITAQGVAVKGSLFLRNKVVCKGEIDLSFARVGSEIDFSSGHFLNPSKTSIDMYGVSANRILLNRFYTDGVVIIDNAEVSSCVDAAAGKFTSDTITSLSIQKSNIKGDVLFEGQRVNSDLIDHFESRGGVYLSGSKIGGDLVLSGGRFLGGRPFVLVADTTEIAGGVKANNAFFDGVVVFVGADIKKTFEFCNVRNGSNIFLDLGNATVGTVYNLCPGWPESGRLIVNGMVYKNLKFDYKPKGQTAKESISWIRRQYSVGNSISDPNSLINKFSAQPYEQLAKFYKDNGFEDESKDVLVAKNDDLLASGRLDKAARVKQILYKWLANYGYDSRNSLYAISFFLLLGSCLFFIGFITNSMICESDNTESRSNMCKGFGCKCIAEGVLYSLDTFLPLVNLKVADCWRPDVTKLTGLFLTVYRLIHVVAGWILTTIFVAGISGLLKN